MIIQTKLCSKCKEEKPLNDFRKGSGKFGCKSYCKPCDDAHNKELYQQNKEYRKLQVQEWNDENHEKTLEYAKKFREKKKNILDDL